MNTTPAITARGPTTEEAIRHHKARRVLEILCENQNFDDLFENNFLAMSYSDRVEFYFQQCGWEDLESTYDYLIYFLPLADEGFDFRNRTPMTRPRRSASSSGSKSLSSCAVQRCVRCA